MANKTTRKQPAKSKKAPPSRYERLMAFALSLKHKNYFRLFVLWLASYLVLMSFFLNTILSKFTYVEVIPNELILLMLMHAVTAAVVSLVMYHMRWIKTFVIKLFSVIFLTLLVVDYDSSLQSVAGLVRAFVPGLTDGDPLPIVSLIYLVLLVLLTVRIGMSLERLLPKMKRLQAKDIELGLMVLVAYLFLVPAFSVFSMLPTMIREARTQAPEISQQKTPASAEEKPDIFYIVLDRYTNADVLKTQFKYDNSPFTDFLRNENFKVNDGAYSNYPYTTMSISSTLNAQYTNKQVAPYRDSAVQSRALYHNLIWQSSVVKALKNEGYKYYSIGSSYGASYKAPLSDREYMYNSKITIFGLTKRLHGIQAIEFQKSPYFRFAQLSNVKWWPAKIEVSDYLGNVRKQLNTLDDLTTKEKPGGRFIFAHILVPHDPFLFNGDGSLSTNSGNDSYDKPIKDKYVGQVQFINSQMKELVTNIQAQSKGKAVVIFNADEGAWPDVLNDTFKKPSAATEPSVEGIGSGSGMVNWSDDYLKMKFGILQAVHIPKATEDDLAHLSSVNLFRIVLNRYAGANLDYLPECHFGLSRNPLYEYNYADITKRLVDNPDKRCEQLQSLPAK